MKEINVATVFSGIGAPEQALKRLDVNHKIIFACDNGERLVNLDKDKILKEMAKLKSSEEKRFFVDELYKRRTRKTNFVQISYLANYKVENNNYFQDVTLLDGNDFKNKVDFFIGGSPCQSFSIAGFRGGFKDTRGTLFYDYARLIKEMQPKVFIYENVYGVLNHDKGKTWKIMQNVFFELGYHFKWQILDAKNYGIPQSRRRLFVVGFKNKKHFDKFNFPKTVELDKYVQYFLEDNAAIGSILSINGELKHINDEKGYPDDRYFLSPKIYKYVTSPGTKNFYHENAETNLKIARALLSTMGNSHRASVDNYYTTNGRLRRLTIREAHRLMGFPDDYIIAVSVAQAYKQAGNSIVVDVLMYLFNEIFKTGVFD